MEIGLTDKSIFSDLFSLRGFSFRMILTFFVFVRKDFWGRYWMSGEIQALFTFIGGLGFFLFGMHVMAEGLQKSSGKKMQAMLRRITDNRLLAVLVGAAVTALIQSSSATTVMVVGFVNAGILNLLQAVGVIMGANIGTTITAWLVSMSQFGSYLKPENYAPLLIGIGAFAILLAKRERSTQIGQIIIGFGMLFAGLKFMGEAVKPYQNSPVFSDAFRLLGENPFLGVLVGLVVTALIQSSSASVGILQTLALSGLVSVRAAIFITLGQNIGTCVTALLSAIGSQRNAKRAAIIHILFNVFGAIIFGILAYIVFSFNESFAASRIDAVGISIFHTIFNTANTIILFPFAKVLVNLSGRLVSASHSFAESEEERLAQVLDARLLETPAFALASATREIENMGRLAVGNVKAALHAILHEEDAGIAKIYETEKAINRIEEKVGEYLVRIENQSMTESMHEQISHLYYTLNDLERIGDHAENIAQIAEQIQSGDIHFSDQANSDLREIGAITVEAVSSAMAAREKMDQSQVKDARAMEERVDELEECYRESHLQRMVQGLCSPTAGVHFLDIIGNLERISDHAKNIAGYVGEELSESHVFAHAEFGQQ